MRLKKMLLPASMALVALSLAIPAMANAEYFWYDDDNKLSPTVTNKKKVEPHGELAVTVGEVQLTCYYRFVGTIWNVVGGMGEGTLKTASAPEECKTNKPTCTISSSTVQNLPWSLTLNAAKGVNVSGIKIQFHLSAGCATYGLEATPIATGSVEGQFNDYTVLEGGATLPATIVFNKAPGLAMGKVGASLDGYLEFGTKVTATTKGP